MFHFKKSSPREKKKKRGREREREKGQHNAQQKHVFSQLLLSEAGAGECGKERGF